MNKNFTQSLVTFPKFGKCSHNDLLKIHLYILVSALTRCLFYVSSIYSKFKNILIHIFMKVVFFQFESGFCVKIGKFVYVIFLLFFLLLAFMNLLLFTDDVILNIMNTFIHCVFQVKLFLFMLCLFFKNCLFL